MSMYEEMFEDTKEVIRSSNSKMDRQGNHQKKEYDKQWYTKHYTETKDRATQTPLKSGGELGFSGRVCSSCSTCGTCSGNKCENIFVCLDHLLLTILLWVFFSEEHIQKSKLYSRNKYWLYCNIFFPSE